MMENAANSAGLLQTMRGPQNDSTLVINRMRHEIKNDILRPHEIDYEDIEHTLITMSNGVYKSVYTTDKLSVRAFEQIGDALYWCLHRNVELPSIHNVVGSMDDHALRFTVGDKTVKFYNTRADRTLSRNSIIVIFHRGSVSAFRNIKSMDKLPRGTVMPVFGCLKTYDQFERKMESMQKTKDDLSKTLRNYSDQKKKRANLLAELKAKMSKTDPAYTSSRNSQITYPRYIACNRIDCPNRRKGEWWIVDAEPVRMFTALLHTGQEIDPEKIYMPDEFIRSYKTICDRISDSLTLESIGQVFKLHSLYQFNGNIETPPEDFLTRMKKAVCKRSALTKLLKAYQRRPLKKPKNDTLILRMCRTFQVQQRRYLRQELNRMMLTTFVPYSRTDPNALLVTYLHWTGDITQLRAYIILTEALRPGAQLRLHPNHIDRIDQIVS